MDELAVKFLKTYQVWHHRRLLVTLTRKPAPELKFIATSLKEDAKNYHTWSYRQWLLAYFNDEDLWRGELDFVEMMMTQDVRNNSAWHHRFFVVFQSGLREGETDRARVVKRELTYVCWSFGRVFASKMFHSYVKHNISLAANNPSAWNYLRGILDVNDIPYANLVDFVKPYATSPHDTPVSDLVDLENPPPARGADLPSPPAIEFLADVYEKEGGTDGLRQAAEVSTLPPGFHHLITPLSAVVEISR